MALLRCDFFSDTLSLSTSMTVILPQRTSTQIGLTGAARTGAPPVLYLLHGLSDDDTIWVRRTSVERYVAPLGIAVIMPQVHRSFYTDQAAGGAYWTFLTEELPAVAHEFFRLSQRREDTFVAGLSMGGYGAWKWALRQPERFAAAANLSGAVNLAGVWSSRTRPEDPQLGARIFGADSPAEGPEDLFWLLSQVDRDDLPRLGMWCGEQDSLYADNLALLERAGSRNVVVDRFFGPGEHDWAYWDAAIQEVLAWLPLDGAQDLGVEADDLGERLRPPASRQG